MKFFFSRLFIVRFSPIALKSILLGKHPVLFNDFSFSYSFLLYKVIFNFSNCSKWFLFVSSPRFVVFKCLFTSFFICQFVSNLLKYFPITSLFLLAKSVLVVRAGNILLLIKASFSNPLLLFFTFYSYCSSQMLLLELIEDKLFEYLLETTFFFSSLFLIGESLVKVVLKNLFALLLAFCFVLNYI